MFEVAVDESSGCALSVLAPWAAQAADDELSYAVADVVGRLSSGDGVEVDGDDEDAPGLLVHEQVVRVQVAVAWDVRLRRGQLPEEVLPGGPHSGSVNGAVLEQRAELTLRVSGPSPGAFRQVERLPLERRDPAPDRVCRAHALRCPDGRAPTLPRRVFAQQRTWAHPVSEGDPVEGGGTHP